MSYIQSLKQILTMLFLLGFLLSKDPKQIPELKYGKLTHGDQIAYDLNELFRANPLEEKEFSVNMAASIIVNSKPFKIQEFVSSCKYANKGFKNGNLETFSAICGGNTLYEIYTDTNNGNITKTVQLAEFKFKKGYCFDSTYSKTLNIYAVACLDIGPRSETGFVQIYTVKRTENTKDNILGMEENELIAGYNFTEKGFIKEVKLNKGSALSSDTQFLLIDEPFIEEGIRPKSKNNLWFFLIDIDANKAPRKVHLVDFLKGDPSLAKKLIKIITVDFIDNKPIIIGYVNRYEFIKTFACNLNVKGSSPKIELCSEKVDNLKLRFAFMQIWTEAKPPRLTYYNREGMSINVCNININDGLTIYKECRSARSRGFQVQNLAFGYFEGCEDNNCSVTYYDRARKNFIGVDSFSVGSSNLKLKQRFKTFGNYGRAIGDRFYSLTQNYIEAFDSKRSEEVLIKAELLKPGASWKFVAGMKLANGYEYRNITGYKIKKFIGEITAAISFPRFKGIFNQMFSIPLGRDYFSGNAINFQISSPGIENHLQYVSEGEVFIKEYNTSPKIFLNQDGLKTAVLDKGVVVLVNCQKTFKKKSQVINNDDKIRLECEKATKPFQLSNTEIFIKSFSTSEAHIVIGKEGDVIFYNKMKGKSRVLKLGFKVKDVDFKKRTSSVLMGIISEDNRIYIYKLNLYESGDLKKITEITKYEKGDAQDTSGNVCPKSIRFSKEKEPILVILNSCKKGDRRLIVYSLKTDKIKFLANTFLRKEEFNTDLDELDFCPGIEVNFVATLGSGNMFGLGIKSQNFIESTGMKELDVQVIYDTICVGDVAIGILAKNSKDEIMGITYFIGRLRNADNRIHSVFKIKGEYSQAYASIGDNRIFYSILTKDGKKHLKIVDLGGPIIYLKSENKFVAHDTEIRASNGNVNKNFDMMVEFLEVNEVIGVEAKHTGESLNSTRKERNLEEKCNWLGPVFDYKIEGKDGDITQRVGKAIEVINKEKKNADSWLFSPSLKAFDGKIFSLVHRPDMSVILVSNSDDKAGNSVELLLHHRCFDFRVLKLPTSNQYHFNVYCIEKGLGKFINADYDIKSQEQIGKITKSSWEFTSKEFTITKWNKFNEYLVGAVDDKDGKFKIFWFDSQSSIGGGVVQYHKISEESNGKIFY